MIHSNVCTHNESKEPNLSKMLPSAVMSRADSKKSTAGAAIKERRTSAPSSPAGSMSQNPSPSSSFNIVTINVAGLRYQTYQETLEKYPETLLGDCLRRKPFFKKAENEYFFDRYRLAFEGILYYYQSSGDLRRPETVPIDIFVNELKFFDLSKSVIDKFLATEGYCRKVKIHQREENSCRSAIWNFLEYPASSISAQVYALLSILIILLSTISFCLETVPKFKHAYTKPGNGTPPFNTTSGDLGFSSDHRCTRLAYLLELTICQWMLYIFIFQQRSSFAFGLRNDWRRLVEPFLCYRFPLYLLVFSGLIRVFRVFKLSRYSNGLRILGKTIIASLEELFLLLFFMMIALIIFSTAVYCVEDRQNFESIPAAFWFTIATMTTVGYGDLTPKEPLGKLVGGLCAILGVLILALPAPVIVANFKCYYDQQKRLALMHTENDDSKDQSSSSKSR